MSLAIKRHFKVQKPKGWLLDSDEFDEWVEDYDRAEFVQMPKLENSYDTIYTSELSRSKSTADMLSK